MQVYDVITGEDSSEVLISDMDKPLSMHQDLVYYDSHRVVQLMHCRR